MKIYKFLTNFNYIFLFFKVNQVWENNFLKIMFGSKKNWWKIIWEENEKKKYEQKSKENKI